MPTRTKIENGRAEFAYKKVKEVKEKGENSLKEYASHVKDLPSIILLNGLAPAIAFVFSKGGSYRKIYDQIQEYLMLDDTIRIKMPSTETDLLEWLTKIDSKQYRYVTEEVLAFTSWLKRIATGMSK